ncbi:alpha/beta hydrolase [Bradyrhizobium sp. Arg314]
MNFRVAKFRRPLSIPGLIVGTLFFGLALTPSLLPRTFVTQGVLSGCSMAVGYLLGTVGQWLWAYLQLPVASESTAKGIRRVGVVLCSIVAIAFLWQASAWQNSVRAVMALGPVETASPLKIAVIALLTFAVLLFLGRSFELTMLLISDRLRRVLPQRLSYVIGGTLAVVLAWSLVNGVFFKVMLRAADSSYAAYDELIEPETPQPADPNKTGSAASLVHWDELGRAGREYVSTGPTAQQLQSFSGKPALEPIRVYIGLRSAETADERASLALQELKRVGAFTRSILIIVTPTGTGWIDPAGMDTVEYLHNGDVASVAIQYSYLSSPLSLLIEPGYGSDASRALFREVYGYWSALPKNHRPKLYLYGLSLGALSSERSSELLEVIGDPYQGALWSGPPFQSQIWRSLTADRNAGSPAWLPRFRDGSYVRFTSQTNALNIPGTHWGPMRIVYLQYASDPVTFFEYQSLYREPDWMVRPRGPDVSPALRWYPVVTFLQLGLDMAMATTTPMGYGHVYAPEHYIDAWVEVTDVQGWTPADLERLKKLFKLGR